MPDANRSTPSGKWYQKYAWVIFLVTGIFFLVSSFGSIFTGGEAEWSERFESITGAKWNLFATSDPRIFKFITLVNIESGVLQIFLAISIITISLTSYRKGERWAWYLFLLIPVTNLINAIVNEFYGVSIIRFSVPFLILFFVGLLLPYRKFFPKQRAAL